MFHPEKSTIHVGKCALPKTNMAPENHWLEDDPFHLGFGLFSGASCRPLGIVPYMDQKWVIGPTHLTDSFVN